MTAEHYPFEKASGFTLTDHQREAVVYAEKLVETGFKQPRMCLYYKTGAGKTLTSLACVKVMGHDTVTVVAPPTTHMLWTQTGRKLGMRIEVMSHATFRLKKTKLVRDRAVIADEMHMFGGIKAIGFRKLESLAKVLQAPMVIASATPNYNDIERCYCIQRITDRRATEGGYLAFLYRHCNTEVNPFGQIPRVVSFVHYPDAASFLADLKHVMYIEDDLVYDIEDIDLELPAPEELVELGVDRRKEKMIGSVIERKHRLVEHMLVTEDETLPEDVLDHLIKVIVDAPTPVLVFAVHTSVARAAVASLLLHGYTATMVHGRMTKPMKETAIDAFRTGQLDVLVGTQTLATGTDGLDKMCDVLVILDDTEDNAMRRQLIGRIMPRGLTSSAHSNRVVRINPSPLLVT